MAQRIDAMLGGEAYTDVGGVAPPLSFSVIVPGWLEDAGIQHLKASRFKRFEVAVPKDDHGFCGMVCCLTPIQTRYASLHRIPAYSRRDADGLARFNPLPTRHHTDGAQHQRRDRYLASPFDTLCFVLQNESGAAKYPIPKGFRQALLHAFGMYVGRIDVRGPGHA